MKTYRVNFVRGINTVGDKAIIQDGYATILDNVDLRSGSPRPFKAPLFDFGVPATITRSWSYRGNWFHSDNWRDYVGEYIGGLGRVYFTEEGKYPKKWVEGQYSMLGTIIPQAPLGVAAASDVSPTSLTATVDMTGGGNLQDGSRTYRVAARTKDGIMAASAPVSVVIDNPKITITGSSRGVSAAGLNDIAKSLAISQAATGGQSTLGALLAHGGTSNYAVEYTVLDPNHPGTKVLLEWSPVPDALSYIIFEGNTEEQYRMDEVSGSQLTYTDTGNKSASGDGASQYVNDQLFTYAYSYTRNVGGAYDEGGLSSITSPFSSVSGRLITRDILHDGFFDTLDPATDLKAVVSLTSADAGTIAPSAAAISMDGIEAAYNDALSQTTFTTATAHGLVTGDKVLFGSSSTSSDPLYTNKTFEVIATSTATFAIKNVKVPTDASYSDITKKYTLPSTTTYRALKSVVSYTSTSEVSTKDVVYVVGLSSTTGETIDGVYKATKLTTSTFSIPFVANSTITNTQLKWVPNNGDFHHWNLYRNEQGGWWKVKEIDLWETSFTDAMPFSSLGDAPDSRYTSNGIVVDFAPPPVSMTSIVSHYGMLFGIYGHEIRWTPILKPDAWPKEFSVKMAYAPVALAAFSQGLIVLCEDAIYRIDGNDPTTLSISKTHAEDGCFAPHSVQATDRGLMYLSKRGIMLFDGTHSICLTDTKIPGTFLTAPSRLATAYPFWWLPTLMTRNYMDLAGEDGILGSSYVFNLDNTKTIEGFNRNIKSFYHLGKYYLYYTGDNYAANTAVCVDMQLDGYPITTLGLKALDAHVDEYEQAYVLLNNAYYIPLY